MPEVKPIAVQDHCRRCQPESLSFETTADLADISNGLGQERAFEAARFAIDMNHHGYNLFVLGEPGSGRHTSIKRLLEERAAAAPRPSAADAEAPACRPASAQSSSPWMPAQAPAARSP